MIWNEKFSSSANQRGRQYLKIGTPPEFFSFLRAHLRVIVNFYGLNVLENYTILWIANQHVIELIIVIGRKYFSDCIAQNNYWIIQTKLLTTLCEKKTKHWNKRLLKHSLQVY